MFNRPAGAGLGYANPFRLNAEDMASAGEGARAAVEQAQFQRAMSLLNPELERSEEQLRQRLANQGLPQASKAFTSELGRFEDTSNRAREQAALAAVLAGGQEQSRMVADMLGVSDAGFGQALQQRQQVGAEQLTERQVPFNEVLSLFNLQRPPSAGDFVAPGQTQMQDMSTPSSQPFWQQALLGAIGAGGQAASGYLMGAR